MRTTLYILLFSLLSLSAIAQPPGGSDPGPGNPTVPISGIEILIAAGGALGLRKLIQSRKTKIQE